MKRTFITFILDETGSMAPVKTKTLSGLNEFIKSQDDPALGPAFMTLVKFNSGGIKTVFENVLVSDIKEVTEKDYNPAWMTPLYDAVAYGISKTEKMVKKQKDALKVLSGQDKNEKPLVIVAIMTDGEENSSIETSLTDLNKLIAQKTRDGWTFTFMGCDQDSWKRAGAMGISVGNTACYNALDPRSGFKRFAAGGQSVRSAYMRGNTVQTSSYFVSPEEEK